jgi:excisionase family DNA binding protein
MRTPTDAKSKSKSKTARKPSSEWARRTNYVPLVERGAFQLPEAADYLSVSVTQVRRWIHRGLIKRIPGIRIILITKAECDQFLCEQTDIAKVRA